MIRGVILGAALSCGLGAGMAQASAVTLDDVVRGAIIGTADGPVPFDAIVDGLNDALVGFGATPIGYTLAGTTVSAFPPGPGLPPGALPLGGIDGSALSDPGATVGFFSFGVPQLFGAVLDTTINLTSTYVEALFSNDGGALSSGIDDYVIVRITAPGAISDGGNSGNLTVQEASLAPIPLPAGAVLLIGGLGALAATRRRKTA